MQLDNIQSALLSIAQAVSLRDLTWQDWTPEYSGMTIGNGTVTAKYIKVGELVFYYFKFEYGSTSTMTNGQFSPPLPIDSMYSAARSSYVGYGAIEDVSAGIRYPVFVRYENGTRIRFLTLNSSATYLTHAGISSTVPITLATGDLLECTGFYKPA